nr:MAG TPA: hypothetical protein [Caudoviricetes sp.]
MRNNINNLHYANRFLAWQQQVNAYKNAYRFRFNYDLNATSKSVTFRDYRVNLAWMAFRAGYQQALDDVNGEKR